jgi:ATP-dependent helicase/nuclease subunit A
MEALTPYAHTTEGALEAQKLALDTASHVWVSASAGTGKTKVLTDRILSLLLKNVNPRKILCLTFTNAAACEMMQRLLNRLGHWSSCSEFELNRELHLLLGKLPSKDLQERARTLFVEVLETPGRFRIQTLHSFCQSLLACFPLEAGLSVETALLTDDQREEILLQVQESVLKTAREDQTLEKAITLLAEQFHYETFKQLCETLLQERIKLSLILITGLENAQKETLKALELESLTPPSLLFENSWQVDQEGVSSLKACALHLLKGKASDQERGQGILDWLEAAKTLESFNIYANHFLTSEGEIRQKLVTQDVANSFPSIKDILFQEAGKIQDVFEVIKSSKIAEISFALLKVSETLLMHYEALKKEKSALDYDDLILKVSALLHDRELAPWILYKLDGGIDHVLIDEAQDTNTLQWSIIKALTEEFFAGESKTKQSRTLFAVGDGKQSIYSFQGTEPKIFTAMRTHFSSLLSHDKRAWKDIKMSLSFRSTTPILEFVDLLFSPESMRAGVEEENPLKHLCYRAGQAGRVELWPLASSNLDSGSTGEGRILLAYQVADQIESWLKEEKFLPSRNRPLEPQDIMVLVQSRTEFVPTLIQSLKTKNIPVAGLDRLNLLDHLAIQDLVFLSEFLLLPHNDFALACVLKSPFGGLEEEDLFILATTRGDKSLWENLKIHHTRFKDLVECLTALLKQVDFVTPFMLYSEILFTHKGLKKILGRFGRDAQDPIEEFLGLAYRYQMQFPSSLQGFLQWLHKGSLEIKRDFSSTSVKEIRIMTVHGAKGLQSPVVILADTAFRPSSKPDFLWDPNNKKTCIWSPPRTLDTRITRAMKNQLKTRQEQENRRLLYVALTRAEDQLYIAGAHENSSSLKNSWYQLIKNSLNQCAQKVSLPGGEGLRLIYSPQTVLDESPPSFVKDEHIRKDLSEPSWLFEEASEEKELLQATSVTKKALIPLQGDSHSVFLLKGQVVHSLLEVLPALPSQAQTRHITSLREKWFENKEIFEDAVKQVQDILNDSSLSCLFQANSKAEVSIMGCYQGKLYTARLDRLVFFKDEIWIIEYKTDTNPPSHSGMISISYRHQLHLYLNLVKQLYPSHKIKPMILWTQNKTLMEINLLSN